MPTTMLRKISAAGIVLTIVVALIVFALPFLASTSVIRNRIANEISNLTGHRVELGKAPEFSLFPNLTVRLQDIRFFNRERGDELALGADEFDITLSSVAAVSGRIEFLDMRIVRPVLHVQGEGNEAYIAPWPQSGKIRAGINTAREAVAHNAENPAIAALPSDGLGRIEIIDGRIAPADGTASQTLATRINGYVDWPKLNSAASSRLKGVWNGEDVELEFSASNPLLLLGGGTGNTSLAVRSRLLTVSFSGKTSTLPKPYIAGTLAIDTPSLAQALRWTNTGYARGISLGAAKLQATIAGDTGRLKLGDAVLALDGNSGKGALEISVETETPLISGTLDFGFLDLGSIMANFSNPPPADQDTDGEIETGTISQIGLDLRLSAAKAVLGPLALTKVAATAQVKGGLAAFDISDAQAFDGSVQAGLRIDQNSGEKTGELRVLATDIDGNMVSSAIGGINLFPQARGTISLILQGPAGTWRELLEESTGSFTAKFRDGSFPHVDPGKFIALSSGTGFFSLAEVDGGKLAFDVAELETTIIRGAATIQKAIIKSSVHQIKLSGIIPYAGRSLALSGSIVPVTEPDAANKQTSFFVGGSWDAPFVSPVISPAPTKQ